jgi:hypothetical protein
MALISSFFGLLIYIFMEKGGKHKKPHIHVKYQGEMRSYDLSGKLLAGEKLPKKQLKILEAWMALKEDEIRASYDAYQEGEIIKIEGLKI